MSSTNKFENLTDLFQSLDLSEAQAGVHRESRARIIIAGPVGVGKSSLYNSLQGWEVSAVQHDIPDAHEPTEEALGLFTLIDLPDTAAGPDPVPSHSYPYDASPYDYGYDDPYHAHHGWSVHDPALWSLEDADLVLFVVDAAAGLRPIDYQWFTRIRAAGCPLLVVLNKIDLLDDSGEGMTQGLRRRLASPVVALSARQGTNVHDVLLPQILNMNPSLTVPLGRDVATCRRQAASHLIRQSALTCGLLGVEPMPLLDVPFQLLTQMRLVMRLAAMYGRAATSSARANGLGVNAGNTLGGMASGASRSVMMALLGGLGLRYAAQQLVKLVPVLGWLVSGLLSASSTWLMGWAAVTYFERAQEGAPLLDLPGGALGWLKERHPELQRPHISISLPSLSRDSTAPCDSGPADQPLRQRFATIQPSLSLPERLKHWPPVMNPTHQQTNQRTNHPTNEPTDEPRRKTPC